MDFEIKNLIREAITSIRRGDVEDGILTLERTIDPKYRSRDHAQGAYLMRDAMAKEDPISGYFAEALGYQAA